MAQRSLRRSLVPANLEFLNKSSVRRGACGADDAYCLLPGGCDEEGRRVALTRHPAAPGIVDASPITFSFTGVVSQDPLLDPDDPFGGSIAFGTLFSGSYVFESTTPDGDPSASGGSYTSAGGTLSVTIGGNTFIASDLLNIGVGNNFSGSDFYTVFAQNTSGADPFDLSLTLQDLNATVFGGALLPIDAPSFAAFELATLFLTGTIAGNQVQIDGQLTSLTCTDGCVPGGGNGTPVVPEPATYALLSVGLAAMYLRRRRARR